MFKNEYKLSEEDLKWNKMCDVRANGELEEPIGCLLTYDVKFRMDGIYNFL